MIYTQTLNQIADEAHDTALEHGFYDDVNTVVGALNRQGLHTLAAIARRDFVLGQLGKVASEVGEAVQAIQRYDVDGPQLETELADIVIRVADLSTYLEINLGAVVHRKMEFNRQRPRKHGKIC